MNRIISCIFLAGGAVSYGNVLLHRDAQVGFIDPRMDVIAIALLGILAHLAFAPPTKV